MVSYLDGLMYGWKVNWVNRWLVILMNGWMDRPMQPACATM